jgi:hypothetical protein
MKLESGGNSATTSHCVKIYCTKNDEKNSRRDNFFYKIKK